MGLRQGPTGLRFLISEFALYGYTPVTFRVKMPLPGGAVRAGVGARARHDGRVPALQQPGTPFTLRTLHPQPYTLNTPPYIPEP